MNFIEKLYYGKVHPYDKIWGEDSEYGLLAKKIIDYERNIIKTLSDKADSEELLATFTLLMDTRSDLTTLVEKERFAEGFRLGVSCGVDVLVMPDGILKRKGK